MIWRRANKQSIAFCVFFTIGSLLKMLSMFPVINQSAIDATIKAPCIDSQGKVDTTKMFELIIYSFGVIYYLGEFFYKVTEFQLSCLFLNAAIRLLYSLSIE